MANNDTTLVTSAKPLVTGALNAAPVGTTLPTDASTGIGSAFKNLGYVSEDGLTNAVERDSEDVPAWGGDIVMSSQTSYKETFSWTFIQAMDPDVLAEVYGADNVTTDPKGVKVLHNSKTLPHRAYVIEMLLTGDRIKRIVIPDGQITEVGDVTYKDGEPVGYEITLTAFPDKEGNTSYDYITPVKTSTSGS
ncbi:phage tail tube protein [Actinomyces urogenitalis]|uniref:phage tail tube protein n=1 Tax=Actinomyces urogenitalis TaxID=103621 RepID=UPI001897B02D|nr:phage tail protein [Actinomyces urogenitalis]